MEKTDAKDAKGKVLLIATLDTKSEEATYFCMMIRESGCIPVVMDTGTLGEEQRVEGRYADVRRWDVAKAVGLNLRDDEILRDKGLCISSMMKGAQKLAVQLYSEGAFDGIVSIGGAQGTDIGTSAMRALPFGVPKLMVSTIANGKATFGPYIGTRDIMIMHSVADIQGLNFLTKEVFANAAAAVSGMVKMRLSGKGVETTKTVKSVALSMLGTTTPGAMRVKELLEPNGYEVVAFHQNGVGGIAMEDMIAEGAFAGVLDLNLHEIGDGVVQGLHGASREYRLETAGRLGLPQVIAPGSINYTVQGPYDALSEEMKRRKYIIHNPNLTLVRLSQAELKKTAEEVARKLNAAKGPVHLFIPLRGFSHPDQKGFDHWEPESNQLFIDELKSRLSDRIFYEEIDAHINETAFVDKVIERFREIMEDKK